MFTFILLHVDVQLFQHQLLRTLLLPPLNGLGIPIKFQLPIIHRLISRISILFHCPVFLSVTPAPYCLDYCCFVVNLNWEVSLFFNVYFKMYNLNLQQQMVKCKFYVTRILPQFKKYVLFDSVILNGKSTHSSGQTLQSSWAIKTCFNTLTFRAAL